MKNLGRVVIVTGVARGTGREKNYTQHLSGRSGKLIDIAKACIYLADNHFINGANPGCRRWHDKEDDM